MSNALTRLEQLLEEDILVRQPPGSYSVKHLSEKNSWIEELFQEDRGDAAVALLRSHLEKNNQSIYALYLLADINARRGDSFSQSMEKLFSIFIGQKKTALVIFIANEILKVADSQSALLTLASLYQQENNQEELLEIWERLLRLDSDDYVLPLKIAGLRDKAGQKNDAVRYYKMAFFRAFEKKEMAEAHGAWKKLVALVPEEFSFLMEMGRKLAPHLSAERQFSLFTELLPSTVKNLEVNPDAVLLLVKECLRHDPENQHLKDTLIKAYRVKYKDHSQLEDFLGLSGLLKPHKNSDAQVDFFEKHVRFDQGAFVHHKSFGYGVIREIHKSTARGEEAIQGTKLVIDFESKKAHTMTLRIALSSLTLCEKNDLHALRLFNPGEAKALIAGDRAKLAEIALKTLGKPSGAQDIKNLFVPALLSAEEWTPLWKELKAVYDADSHFEIKNKLYALSTTGGSYQEEILKQFQNTKDMDQRTKIFDLYLAHFRKLDASAEPMIQALAKEAASGSGADAVKALLLLKSVEKSQGVKAAYDFNAEFKKNLDTLGEIPAFDQVRSPAHKILFIEKLPEIYPADFDTRLVKLFLAPTATGKGKIIEILLSKKKDEALSQIRQKLQDDKLTLSEHYLMFVKHGLTHGLKSLGMEGVRVYPSLLEIFRNAHRDLEKDPHAALARRVASGLQTLLFGEGHLFEFLKSEESKPVRKNIFDHLAEMSFLENYLKVEIKELATKLA